MSDLILSAKDFKTLSSETRVQIIKLLSSRNYNLTELSNKLKLAMPSIKQHIDVLLESNLIEQVDSTHKWKYYSLSRKGRKLVEPYSSQVFIVLASSFIGFLGVALIASAFFGTQGASFGDSDNFALNDATKTLQSGASVPSATGVSENSNPGEVAENAPMPLEGPGLSLDSSSLLNVVLVIFGVLLLAFSVLVFRRKVSLFR